MNALFQKLKWFGLSNPRFLFSSLLFLIAMSFLNAQITFYVAPNGNDSRTGMVADEKGSDGPLENFEKAIEQVRLHFSEHHAPAYKIVLREGVYHIRQAIEITPEDDYELIVEAYPGESPVISAGKKIEGWKKSRINGVKCWKTHIPEVKSGDWYFRQLFVNGKRASRPRVPETGFFEVEDPLLGEYESMNDKLQEAARDRFIFREGDIENWSHIKNVDIIALHYWVEEFLPVKEVDLINRMVIFNTRSDKAFVRSHPAHSCGNAWYYADNVFEALDSHGEWYLRSDQGILYYIPEEGQILNDPEFFAPVIGQIFRISGNRSAGKFAGKVHFSGIDFQHTKYTWEDYKGSGNYTINSGPAMIYLDYAKECSFTACKFQNLGDYALHIDGGSEDIDIQFCHFYDMASGAILVDSRDEDNQFLVVKDMTKRINIRDNEIHNGGRVFHGSPAFVSNYVQRLRFNHNHISDFYYNGMACGYPKRNPACYDNLIMNNLIHDIGKGWLSDMGGIYVKGLQPGMVIRGNVIFNIDAACYGGNAVYLDDYAEHIIVENNLLYNAGMNVINMKGRENLITKNVMAFGGKCIIRSASVHPMDTLIARIYSNIMIVNDKPVYRTRNDTPIEKPRLISDYNIIWNLGQNLLKVERPFYFSRPSEFKNFEYWTTKTSNDINSKFLDPQLKNPDQFDFSPIPGSPAEELGIDFSLFTRSGVRKQVVSDSNPGPLIKTSGIGHVD